MPSGSGQPGLARSATAPLGPQRHTAPVSGRSRPNSRQALAVHKDDPAALRVLARASARLGRDAAATAIYERRLDDKALEAEDHLMLGLLHHRQGRADAAAPTGKKCSMPGSYRPGRSKSSLVFRSRRIVWDDAILATERLSGQPGWEARASMMQGAIRLELNNVPGAANSFRRALELDPAEIDISPDPTKLRKVIARTFLRMARSAEATNVLQPILERGPDEETNWLLLRVYLQEGDKTRSTGRAETGRFVPRRQPVRGRAGPIRGRGSL